MKVCITDSERRFVSRSVNEGDRCRSKEVNEGTREVNAERKRSMECILTLASISLIYLD